MIDSSKVDFYNLAMLLAFQAPIIGIVICTYIFCALRRNGLTRRQFNLIRGLVVCCVGTMVGEVLSGMLLYGATDWDISWVFAAQNLGYLSAAVNTVLFCEYCISVVGQPRRPLCRLLRVLYVILGVALLARMLLSGTKLFSYLNEEGGVSFGPLDDLQTWIRTLTDVVLTVMLLGRYLDKKEYVNRERNRKLLLSAVMITAAGLVYVTLYLPYVNWIGDMFMLLYLYLSMQGLMIDRDELTSLNNRRRLLKDIERKNREKLPWSYVLADVDGFKQINDSHGHNEGDRALTLIGTALNETALQNSAAAYRLGGDEFAFLIPTTDEETVKRLCAEAQERLKALADRENLPYTLTVSMGHAANERHADADVREILELADSRMYENKQARKEQEREA